MNQFDQLTTAVHNSNLRTVAPCTSCFTSRFTSRLTSHMCATAMLLMTAAIPAAPLHATTQSDAQVPIQPQRQEINDVRKIDEYRAMLRRRLSQLAKIQQLPEIANDQGAVAMLKSEYESIVQTLKSNPITLTRNDFLALELAIEQASTTYAAAFGDISTTDASELEALQKMRSELKQLRDRLLRLVEKTERQSLSNQIVDLETKLAQSPRSEFTVITVSVPPALFVSSSIFEASLPEGASENRAASRKESIGVDEVMSQVQKVLWALQSTVEITRSTFLPDISIAGPAWEVAEARDLLEAKMASIAERVNAVQARIFEQDQRKEIDRQRHLAFEARSCLISIEWKGGTLSELLQACGETRMNVVLVGGEATANAIIPSLTVQDVEPSVFFRALATTPLEDGRTLRVVVTEPAPTNQTSTNSSQPTLADVKATAAERSLPVITISLNGSDARGADDLSSPAASIGTDVYDISAYLKANPGSMEKINDAISTALELSGGIEEIRVRLHEPTGLLFVRGPITQRKAVSQVVQFFTR